MYIPQHFSQDDPAILLEVMQRHNFATLVSNQEGAPFATHLPALESAGGRSACTRDFSWAAYLYLADAVPEYE